MIGVGILLIIALFGVVSEKYLLSVGCLIGIIFFFVITEKTDDVVKALEYPPEHLMVEVKDTTTYMSPEDSVWAVMTDMEKEKTILFYNEFIKDE